MLYGAPRPGANIYEHGRVVQEPGFEPHVNDAVRLRDDRLSPNYRVIDVSDDHVRVQDIETGQTFNRRPDDLELIGVFARA